MTNCPNCGAPITGRACDYCGTAFHIPQDPIKAKTMLELENEYLKRNMAVQRLYEEAIFAMRAYSSGAFTANEAREHVGLPKI